MYSEYYAIIDGDKKFIETDPVKVDKLGSVNSHIIIKRFGKKNNAEDFLYPKKKEFNPPNHLPMLNATLFYVQVIDNVLYTAKIYRTGEIDKFFFDDENSLLEHLKTVQGNIYIITNKNLLSIKCKDSQPYVKIKILSNFGTVENEYQNLNSFNR